ncbi:hypothetical protein H4219_002171 [Mycoemilia scoparia]|uniref:Amino acid transporter transmembrane domain-containing protein n=1 Tax=Mycoemilia scoparia TaxID=417184 RepID=A0A9W8DUR3_9FUNG|nr:hypothetical protein H4219_002171 [Mycoemilia scoparia]
MAQSSYSRLDNQDSAGQTSQEQDHGADTSVVGNSAEIVVPTSATPLSRHSNERSGNSDHGETALEPTATVFSSSANLANTIIGSGMLAMPAALATMGIGLGVIMIVFSACTSMFGLHLLACSARRVSGRNSSFFEISKLTYPGAGIFFDAAIAIKCFGVSISYLIIFSDLMPEVMESFGIHVSFLSNRDFWTTVAILVLAPLAFQRRLDALKYTSVISLSSVVLLLVLVAKFYFSPDRKPIDFDKIVIFRWSSDFFTKLPIFVFGFTCHQNIFSVHNELRDNSTFMINWVIVISISVACAVYQWVAILGYLSFGEDTKDNLLLNYDKGTMVTLCRLGVAILVLFSYPLQCHPARASIDKIAITTKKLFQQRTSSVAPGSETQPISNPSTQNSVGNTSEQQQGSSGDANNSIVIKPMSMRSHVIITTALLILSYIVAMSVTSLTLVLSFVGSTGSTTISFILPGLFYYKIHKADSIWTLKKTMAFILMIYGFVVLTTCLTTNIVTNFVI